jgi:hypothetical protein
MLDFTLWEEVCTRGEDGGEIEGSIDDDALRRPDGKEGILLPALEQTLCC